MKKGQLQFMIIPIIIMALLFGTFLFIFLKEMTDQYYIGELQNAAATISNDTNLGAGYNDTIITLNNAYDNTNIDYDLFVIFLFVVALIGTSFTAIQAQKQGLFSFFGYIFIISMIFLLVIFFVEQLIDWFFEQIFNKVFNDTNLDIPFTEWLFENIGFISISWFIWLGFLNFLDFREIADRITGAGGFER